MSASSQAQPTEFPDVRVAGFQALRTVDRPPAGRWPARRQIQYVGARDGAPDALVRVDLFEADGAEGLVRVVDLLRAHMHAAEAAETEPRRTEGGAVRWEWRNIWIVGRGRWVALLRSPGDEPADLAQVADEIEGQLGAATDPLR